MRPCTFFPVLMAASLLILTALPLEAQRRRAPASPPPSTAVRALPVKTATLPMRVLANALTGVVRDGKLTANACGGANRNRRHRVSVAGYSNGGGMGRLEYRMNGAEVAAAAIQHSLQDPGTGGLEDPSRLLDLGKGGHPSPILHTITRVRMCVDHFSSPGWSVMNPLHSAKAARTGNRDPVLVVRVPLSPMRLKGRAMPAEYGTGALGVDGLNVGIKWGHRITDMELPDYSLQNRSMTVTLTLVDDGRGGLTYGAARAGFSGGWGPGWTDNISNYAPRSVQNRLLRYRNQELQRLRRAVQAAFDDGRTRAAVSRALTGAVRGAPHGVGSIVSVEMATNLRGGEPALTIRYR
ncbi:MAG: hypothetical protein R3326_00560 [Gemmatimonadota bacterium]|nr:hypothetical protein [Gemmatimonadota bacterium]